MINVTIHNFRKVQEASFDIAPIALLVGENENGKSSIAQAVALASAQQPLPKNIAKKDAKQLVNDLAKSGKVMLSHNGVTSEISWPLAEFKTTGQGKPITASEFAVGLRTIFQLSAAERVAYFIRLLKAEPTLKDLQLVLPKSLDPKLEEIWKQIQESGWEEAHSTAKSEEAELTGKWKHITGESRWNVSTAGDWRPAAWEPELERADRSQLEIAFAECNKAFEDALKSEGAIAFDRSQLEAQAAKIDESAQAVTTATTALTDAEASLRQLSQLLAAIPTADGHTLNCPECGTELMLQASEDLLGEKQLVRAAQQTPEQQEEYHRLGKALKDAASAVNQTKEKLVVAQHQLKASQDAKTKLESITEVPISEQDSGSAKKSLERAERQLDMFNAVQRARATYESILTQKELVAALHQNGVRKAKLDEQLKAFNDQVLKPLSNMLNSEVVWLDGDLNPWRGNRPYHLLSRSARYAVRVLLQVAIAKADQSDLMVIDDMDEINDRRNRGCLMSMIISSGIPALVCMAKRPEENAPDLAAKEAGNTYAVIEGKVHDLSAMQGQEAQVA